MNRDSEKQDTADATCWESAAAGKGLREDFLEEGVCSKRQSKWVIQRRTEAGHRRREATRPEEAAGAWEQPGKRSKRDSEAEEGTLLPPAPQSSCHSFLAQPL